MESCSKHKSGLFKDRLSKLARVRASTRSKSITWMTMSSSANCTRIRGSTPHGSFGSTETILEFSESAILGI